MPVHWLPLTHIMNGTSELRVMLAPAAFLQQHKSAVPLTQATTCAAQECVRLMMTYNDKRRPSARDMLGHEWIREGGVAGSNVIEPEVLHRMRSFAAMNKLKKKALLVRRQLSSN